MDNNDTPNPMPMDRESFTQSAYPPPPITYINLYTDENVKQGLAPKPPPIQDSYRMFGNTFHTNDQIIRPLEGQNIRRLYPATNLDHKRELKKLNHSAFMNYLDLLDIILVVSASPDSDNTTTSTSSKRKEKLDDISIIFINMHHLINEYRPHQARETLRVMMEVQKRQSFEICDRLQKQIGKSLEIVRKAGESGNGFDEQEQDPGKAKNKPKSNPTKIVGARKLRSRTRFVQAKDQDEIMCEIADQI